MQYNFSYKAGNAGQSQIKKKAWIDRNKCIPTEEWIEQRSFRENGNKMVTYTYNQKEVIENS